MGESSVAEGRGGGHTSFQKAGRRRNTVLLSIVLVVWVSRENRAAGSPSSIIRAGRWPHLLQETAALHSQCCEAKLRSLPSEVAD